MLNPSCAYKNFLVLNYQNWERNDCQENKSILAHTGAGVVALASGMGVRLLITKPISRMMKSERNLANRVNDCFKNAVQTAFETSGLPDKGVKFINTQNWTEAEIVAACKNSLTKRQKLLPQMLQKLLVKRNIARLLSYKNGNNACFVPTSKQIRVNTEKFICSAFHEMGHAKNNFTKLGRFLQKH